MSERYYHVTIISSAPLDEAPGACREAWPDRLGELVTDRLTMTPLGREHLDDMVDLYADHEVVRFLAPLDRNAHGARLLASEESWRTLRYGRAAVIDTASGRFVGRAGLVWWAQMGEVEASWALRRDSWGLGFATEAAQAWIRWGLEHLAVAYLTANIHPDNEASLAVAGRLGMVALRSDNFHGTAVVVHAVGRTTITP